MDDIDTPVLIVGGGPVGLLGAQLLGLRGLSCVVAEKYETRLPAPKAHALNPRSLEICAAAGLDMAALHGAATPTEEGRHVRFMDTLAGREIGVLPYERQDAPVREVTPWPLINIAQPAFERVIEMAVAATPSADLRRGLEWRDALQLDDCVISTLIDRATGREVKARSRYVIAADGAGSPVRESLGIPMDGPEGLAWNMMIHIEADLRPLVGERPAILYFLYGPASSAVLIAYDIGKTWVLMHPCSPTDTAEDFDEDRCRAIADAAFGAEIPLAIKGVRPWAMSAQVARRYRDRRVFLAGDAGHRFPPTGGLGLNTGIGDIDNLTWKIAAVEAGWAWPDLLDSYEAERRTIAQTNLGQSLANAMRMRALWDALGLAPDQSVDAATFEHRLSDPTARAAVDAAVDFQKDHFDSLRLQIGYAYGGALKADDILPISAFTPKVVAGARLPHHALADGRSILDLIDPVGLTLLCGPNGAAWGSLRIPGRAPMHVHEEDQAFIASDGAWARAMGLSPDGAILVRPDGHILGIATEGDPASLARMSGGLGDLLKPVLEGAL